MSAVASNELVVAVRRRNVAGALEAIHNGGDVNTFQLLQAAAETGSFVMVKVLIEAGSLVAGSRAIIAAAAAGNRPITELLLAHGAQPCEENFNAIRFAEAAGFHDVAELLLEHTSDRDRLRRNGYIESTTAALLRKVGSRGTLKGRDIFRSAYLRTALKRGWWCDEEIASNLTTSKAVALAVKLHPHPDRLVALLTGKKRTQAVDLMIGSDPTAGDWQ